MCRRQDYVLWLFEGKKINHEIIDISNPSKVDDRDFMKSNAKVNNGNHALPPQVFNDEEHVAVRVRNSNHSVVLE